MTDREACEKPRLLSLEQAAEWLGITYGETRTLVRSGALPRRGGYWATDIRPQWRRRVAPQ